jgi:hypothetical protein
MQQVERVVINYPAQPKMPWPHAGVPLNVAVLDRRTGEELGNTSTTLVATSKQLLRSAAVVRYM